MLEQLNLLTEQETITEIVRVKQVVMERPVAYAEGITSTERAGRLGMNEIGDEAQEVVLILILNTKNQINAIHRVFTGSLNASVAHPREIFRSAILNNGARIILYHNHPSSDLLNIVS
ncbi:MULTISPECIES: JAB domain-containing protein [Enterococcus]|uniref:JAB domain-containing protein n=1 Tax=Enterococcus TaxID=1350 RepID=UPI00132F7CFB|nr:JAB domain-containing protein [Enterococcus casseliflavus]